MGVLQMAISGEVVHDLNFSGGFHFMLQPAYFGTVWAGLSVATSLWQTPLPTNATTLFSFHHLSLFFFFLLFFTLLFTCILITTTISSTVASTFVASLSTLPPSPSHRAQLPHLRSYPRVSLLGCTQPPWAHRLPQREQIRHLQVWAVQPRHRNYQNRYWHPFHIFRKRMSTSAIQVKTKKTNETDVDIRFTFFWNGCWHLQ